MVNNLMRMTALILTVVTTAVYAGQTCTEKTLAPSEIQKAFYAANKLRKILIDNDVEVALIARAGQDLSKYGLRYSHAGFVMRDHPKGKWIVIHELNHCGTGESEVYDEGLANFFLDDMIGFDSLIVIPHREKQRRLAALLSSSIAGNLHKPTYNMLAYPFSTRYQNSNGWVLEVLSASLMEKSMPTRSSVQDWYKMNGYVPATIRLSALERLGGRLFRANVAFDDQPLDERVAGRIKFVSVESIADFYIGKIDKQAQKIAIEQDSRSNDGKTDQKFGN